MSMLYGLKLIKGQWGALALAMVASFLILALDYLLSTSMPKVISGLNLMLADGNLSNAPKETIAIAVLIILRPVIGWLINLYQINIILNILRKLEDEICFNGKQAFLSDPFYSSENYANMVISHGRYYVDAYLIPLIRALTDVGSILVISVGLALQFPVPLVLFIGSITVVLVLYHLIVRKILSASGKLLLDSYEKIMTLSRNGFNEELTDQDQFLDIAATLDDKKRASLSLGSLSQGLRYVIEFAFMFSFGIASIYVVMNQSESFAIFLSTFAYAGVRMLPSFTTVLAFTQGKTSAEHPIKELSLILNTK
jgi:hypothetical protein